MPDQPASSRTATENINKIWQEGEPRPRDIKDALIASNKLRQELADKGLKGFKKGGKVKATGKAKVHKGEYVLKKSAADKIGTKKLNRMNRGQSDKRLLQRTPFRR